MTKQLTVRTIENLKPRADRYGTADGLIPGLELITQPTGAKSWALRYRFGRVQKKLTIGTYPAIDLKTARDLARGALVSAAKGRDPATEKQKAKAVGGLDLVENVVAEFIERHSKRKNGARHIQETQRILTRDVIGKWKGRRLGEIGRADVHELLDRVVDRGATIMANRVLAALRKLCNWAIERGIIATSPCDKLKAPAAEKSRDRTLSDDSGDEINEIKLAWTAFEEVGWPFGPLAKLLLLTGARRDEVGCMRWSEVDLKARMWIIPPSRSKNKLEHQVPLSAAAIAVLESLPRIAGSKGFVFTTTGEASVSGFSKAKKAFDKLIAESRGGQAIPDWTLHDLRRTAASGMASLGVPPQVCDACLNHKSGTIKGVTAVYLRYNYAAEKRSALDAWAQRLAEIISK
jgi:integrase